MTFPNTTFISRVTRIPTEWLQAVNDFVANFAGGVVVSALSSIAELRNTPITAASTQVVRGYYVPGDGGGGTYYYDAADVTSVDNGGTIIVATDGGRWKLAAIDVISVKQFGAKGDGATDDIQAMNNAAAWCISVGANLRFPAGRYITHSTWIVDMSGVTNSQSRLRLNIIGDGMTNTQIYTDSQPFCNMTGGAYNTPALDAYFRVEGIFFWFAGLSSQPGINLTEAAYIEFNDCQFTGFSVGLAMTNILVAVFNRTHFRSNTEGFTIAPIGAAQKNPNAITFNSCGITSNTTMGGTITKPGNVCFMNCTIEDNGTMGNVLTGGLNFISPGAESPAGLALRSCYFEVNKGGAEVFISHGNTPATYEFDSCNFNRTEATAYTTNNIYITQSTSRFLLNVDNSGFENFGSYVPNTGRKYIAISSSGGTYLVRDEMAYYHSTLETPSFKAGRHQLAISRAAAWGVFSPTSGNTTIFPSNYAAIEGYNFTTTALTAIRKHAVGDFSFFPVTTFGSNDVAVSVMCNAAVTTGNPLIPVIVTTGNTEIRIQFRTAAGALADPVTAITLIAFAL